MKQKRNNRSGRIAKILIISISSLIGFTIGLLQVLTYELPDPSVLENYQPSLPTNIYDKDNRLITSFYIEMREIVNLSQIPDNLKYATLAIEDKRFYSHWGIDPIRIVKALWVDLITWSRRQGASTLTQQLARDLFLTKERTILRKIKSNKNLFISMPPIL